MPITLDIRTNLFWRMAYAEGFIESYANFASEKARARQTARQQLLSNWIKERFGDLPHWAQERLASLDDQAFHATLLSLHKAKALEDIFPNTTTTD